MKQYKLFALTILLGVTMLGCSAKEEEPAAAVENQVVDYTNTTVFELLELSDNIRFVGKSEGSDILANADDILTRFSANDFNMLFGENTDEAYQNSMRFFFNSLSEWDREFLNVSDESIDARTEYEREEDRKLEELIGGEISEKDRVISIILEIEDYFTENNINLPNNIGIAKYVDLFEFEDAFNVDSTIFLSENLLSSHKEIIKDEIIRQLFLVYLNSNPDKEEELFAKIGFSKCIELVVDEEIIPNKYTNPNASKLNYAFNSQYAGSNIMFIPISYIKKNQEDLGQFQMISKYYSVDISQEETKIATYDKAYNRDENGDPIILDLADFDNFDDYFFDKNGDFKHPRLITSKYFIDIVNNRATKNQRIVNFINETLK